MVKEHYLKILLALRRSSRSRAGFLAIAKRAARLYSRPGITTEAHLRLIAVEVAAKHAAATFDVGGRA